MARRRRSQSGRVYTYRYRRTHAVNHEWEELQTFHISLSTVFFKPLILIKQEGWIPQSCRLLYMQFSGDEEEILTYTTPPPPPPRNYGIIVLLLSDYKSICHYAERQLSQQITEIDLFFVCTLQACRRSQTKCWKWYVKNSHLFVSHFLFLSIEDCATTE